jgi:hypothetical protein
VVTIKAQTRRFSGGTAVKQLQNLKTGGMTIKETALLFYLTATMKA